jgi:hypothetical protein
MKQFQFQLIALGRVALRESSSEEMKKLNDLGQDGWHIVHVKEDPQHNRDLLIFMERDVTP